MSSDVSDIYVGENTCGDTRKEGAASPHRPALIDRHQRKLLCRLWQLDPCLVCTYLAQAGG